MSTPTLVYRRIEAKALPVYACSKCGASSLGSTVRVELNLAGSSAAEVGVLLGRQVHVSNSHMPVGWAGYGIDDHRCPGCQ